MDELIQGAGVLPDNPASAGTPEEGAAPELTPVEPVVEGQEPISDATPPVDETGDISEDLKSEMESVIESKSDDSQLVKKLRDLVKTKYEDFASKTQPELTDAQKAQLDLVNGLFEFDVDRGVATTRNFAQNLAKRDVNLASQAFDDLSSIPLDENGYTLGHRFLESIGLDPYKIEELRQFSRGEINPTDYGIVAPPPNVPKEFVDAYKSLDPVSRTDVDIYLDSENESQQQAAMRILRDRQANIDNDRYRQEFESRQKEVFNSEVTTATASDLETTYSGILTSLKSNPAYTSVTISSDKNVDTMVKDSIIAQLNALGDPRSVLAQQAVTNLESRGVKVDLPKITQLMQAIEDNTKVAISAEKMGKLQRRDYTTQIQEALARKSQAVSSLIALGNKYFSQTLANLTGVKTTNPNPTGSIPSVEGSPVTAQPGKRGVKSPAELDQEILQIAKSIAASNS